MALIVLDSISAVASLHILISSSIAKHLKHSLLRPEVFTGWWQGLYLALARVTHVLVWIVHIVRRHKLVVRRRASIVIRRALKPGMAQFIIWWQWGAYSIEHVATARVNRCCTSLKMVGRAFFFLVILSSEAASIPVVDTFWWAEVLWGWCSLTKGHSSTAFIYMFLIFSLICFSAIALFQVFGNKIVTFAKFWSIFVNSSLLSLLRLVLILSFWWCRLLRYFRSVVHANLRWLYGCCNVGFFLSELLRCSVCGPHHCQLTLLHDLRFLNDCCYRLLMSDQTRYSQQVFFAITIFVLNQCRM